MMLRNLFNIFYFFPRQLERRFFASLGNELEEGKEKRRVALQVPPQSKIE